MIEELLMKASFNKLGLIAVLLMGYTGISSAATTAQVNISGTVNATTCDISTNRPTVDLGNVAPSSFTTANTPITSAEQHIKISMTNCTGTPPQNGQAAIKVTGPVTNAGATFFGNDPTSDIGISLKNGTSDIANNDVINMGTAGAATTDLDKEVLDVTASLKSSTTPVTGGKSITAPITFSFIYN